LKADKYIRIELLAILATGLLKFVMMDWLGMRSVYIFFICIFWLSYIYFRYISDKSVLNHWGFRRENFIKSFAVLFPFILISNIITFFYGKYYNTIILSWHIIPVLGLYPVWGVFQQYLMVDLIAGNLDKLAGQKLSKSLIIILTSLIFCFVHYPNFFLMIFTFSMEVVFMTVFMKWRNLWALGLAHGWIASFLLYYVLGRDLWTELFVWF
jgi:hypothetical protein